MITAYWWQSNNFGDNLTPWMIERLTGERPMWVNYEHQLSHQVWAGSILNWANPYAVVWGAGLGSIGDAVHISADIRAVRGPVSAMRARACGATVPELFGDPGLCLPRLIAKPPTRPVVGVAAHYIDQFRAYEVYRGKEGFEVIDLCAPVAEVVQKIASCEVILSSSLHGLVVAHAYGVPAVWVKYSNGVCGDGTKFVDHLAAVGMLKVGDWAHPLDLREDGRRALATDRRMLTQLAKKPSEFSDEWLWSACPITEVKRG